MDQKPEQKNQSEQKPTEVNRPQKKMFFAISFVVLILLILVVGSAVIVGVSHFKGSGRTEFGPGMMGRRGFSGNEQFGKKNMMTNRQSGAVTAWDQINLTIKTSDNAELTAKVSETTSYYKQNAIAKQSDLKVGDQVSIVGRPDSSGVIQAQIINIQRFLKRGIVFNLFLRSID